MISTFTSHHFTSPKSDRTRSRQHTNPVSHNGTAMNILTPSHHQPHHCNARDD